MTIEDALLHTFGLTDEELVIVLPYFRLEDYSKGTLYLRQGLPVNKIGFIKEGITREYFISDDKEITKFIGTAGKFISDVSGVNLETPSRWNIETVTKCSIYTLQKDDITFIRKILPRWNEIEKKFITQCLLSAENRILQHLQLNAEERYLNLMKQSPEIFNVVELKHLASYIGITPETLSRFRTKHSR